MNENRELPATSKAMALHSTQDEALSFSKVLQQEVISPDYFILHYNEFLPRYISNGRPYPF